MDMMNPSRVENTSSKVQKCLSELGLQPYSNVEIMSFTSNLLESNKIGSGGYGEVYKGHLPSDILIAVKVLENMDIVEDTFIAEVSTMVKAVHRNLIKLYGYCFEDVMKALVFEYMENGSLDKILYENHHSDINWEKLYGIAIGTEKGLNYLHNDLDEQIIHYDIKPANVLLDKNFSAKIADFGLTKIMNRDVSCVDVSRIRGTPGFIAPEIWTPGLQVSCKCDVYSFGMMLFEIIGKRSNGVGENWFPGIVWKKFKSGKLEQLIRDCGITENDKEKAILLSKVALRCAHHIPQQRPSMMEVVLMLYENLPVGNLSYPFLPGQFSDSLMVPSQEGFQQVFLEVPLAGSKRKWVDSLERDPAYPSTSHASITGGGNNGPDDDGALTLSNVPKKLSPNLLEEDLATLVPNKSMKFPTSDLVGKTTALKDTDIIMQQIANDEAVKIGVYGMGGKKQLERRYKKFKKLPDSLELMPDSISDLGIFRDLCSSWYDMLKKLPSLATLGESGKLKLNNSGSGIEEQPECLKLMVNLRCLNLHGVELKKRIPEGLIQNFSSLQELYLGGINVDKLYDVGRGKSFAEELLSLKKLENLSVSFRRNSDYASYVGSPKFKGLKLFFLVNCQRVIFIPEEFLGSPQATIQLMGPIGKQRLAPVFPHNTRRVEIAQNNDVIRLGMLGWLIKDLDKLVEFKIHSCYKTECIWSSEDEDINGWLRRLEIIHIVGCRKLHSIFMGIPFSSDVVFCLRQLNIGYCDNLKNVFPSSTLLQLLQNLEQIKIDSCKELEKLIGDDEEEETKTPITIPRLKYLEILKLPKLKRIWRGVMICDSLKRVSVRECMQLKVIPQFKGKEQLTPPPALVSINGSRKWWDSLEWDLAYPESILEPFFWEGAGDLNSESDDEDNSMSEGM